MEKEAEEPHIDTATSSALGDDCYVHDACSFGITRLHVPYHLKDKQLYIRVQPRLGQQTVTVKLTVEREPPPPNEHGWKRA